MLLSLLISVVLIPIVLLTYKIKNSILRWCFIIIPPLFVIFLYWIPWDILTMAFWVPAYVAFLWSIISIVINTVRIIIRKLCKKPQVRYCKIRFLRPTLTIIIFLIASTSVYQSLISANEFGIETAKKIQIVANTNGICPKKLEGWKPDYWDPNNSVINYGKYGAKYRIRYKPSENWKEFKITVRHNIDSALSIYGGVNTPLTTDRYVEGQWIKVPIEEIK